MEEVIWAGCRQHIGRSDGQDATSLRYLHLRWFHQVDAKYGFQRIYFRLIRTCQIPPAYAGLGASFTFVG